MDLQLNNKTAFISGSTAGIGYATAQQLLSEGANVIINGRTGARVNDALLQLRAQFPKGQVRGIAADFAKAADVDALIKAIPQLDILINNVSIFEPKPFTEITDGDWLRFFEINVLSGVRLSRHFLPQMLSQNWGRIIFISSESALNIPEEMIHYGMTKTAQLAIARGMAELTRGTKVTVNSILPGPTKSEGVNDFLQSLATHQKISAQEVETNFFKEARPTSILQRFMGVEEIAHLITFMASPLSSATNGASLRADGGVIKTIA